MKNYDAYVFDLYGTLIDIHTDEYALSFWKKVRDLFSSYNAGFEAKELRHAYFSLIHQLESAKKEDGHLIEIEIAKVFQELFAMKGIVLTEKQISEIAWRFRQFSTTHLRLYAGAEELLQSLRDAGAQVYLLSNAQTLFTLPELQKTGVDHLFDDIVISSAIGYRKPDVRIYEYLLKKHHLKAENCLMIGNDLQADIQGAIIVGMDTCYIRSALSPAIGSCEIRPTYYQNRMDLKHLRKRFRADL